MKNYKKDFPIFKNNKDLVYLDSSATSQKPKIVIDAIKNYYEFYNANVHRGLYSISEKATEKVEEVRKKVAKFINAKDPSEIIFVRNTTEAINLVASSWGRKNIREHDIITTTIMEHHSNFVPWQQLCLEKDAKLEVIDIDNNYKLKTQNSRLASEAKRANIKTTIQDSKLIAITHVSNVLGTINSLKDMIKEFKMQNSKVKVLVDGAQSVPHIKVDVQDLDSDFFVFSGHKMMADTGIGILYAKKDLLKKMDPIFFGGGMINSVNSTETIFTDIPHKFEAGTPDIAGIVSLGAAIEYLNYTGIENVQKHERDLTKYCLLSLSKVKGINIYGPVNLEERIGVISFNINGIHAHDVSQILADMNICVRAGHHCTMPLHQKLGIPASVRVSFYLYNNKEDIDKLVKGIQEVKKIFKI